MATAHELCVVLAEAGCPPALARRLEAALGSLPEDEAPQVLAFFHRVCGLPVPSAPVAPKRGHAPRGL
jgi:hypothetical protein